MTVVKMESYINERAEDFVALSSVEKIQALLREHFGSGDAAEFIRDQTSFSAEASDGELAKEIYDQWIAVTADALWDMLEFTD